MKVLKLDFDTTAKTRLGTTILNCSDLTQESLGENYCLCKKKKTQNKQLYKAF